MEKAISSDNPVTAFYSKLKKARGDWLGTSTYTYVQSTAFIYDSTIGKLPISYENEKPVNPSKKISLNTEKPKIMLAKVSANDTRFEEKENFHPEKRNTGSLEKVAYTPVAEVVDIVQSIKQERKMKAIDKVQNDRTIREDVRRSITEKLEKVADLQVYYQQNIAHYEAEARKGSLYAKQILPGLHKLL